MNGQSRPEDTVADTRSFPRFQGTRCGVTRLANGKETGSTIARLSAPAQNIQVWIASVLFRLQPTSAQWADIACQALLSTNYSA
jgi:hypothetical protein